MSLRATDGPLPSAWAHVARVAAALAAGMGVGRFVYTPILPLMHAQAGLSTDAGAHLATANYVGYLLGALAGTLFPALVRSRAALRGSLVLLIGTLAAMPATHSTGVWIALRLLAGVASALIFVVAVSSLLGHLRDHPPHLPGWAFGGVGAGIALSGLLVLGLPPSRTGRPRGGRRPPSPRLSRPPRGSYDPRRRPHPQPTPLERRLTPGSAPCSSATPWRASATSSPGPSWSPRSDRAPPAGSAAARGCSSGWPPYRPRRCGRGSGAAGRGPGCCSWRW